MCSPLGFPPVGRTYRGTGQRVLITCWHLHPGTALGERGGCDLHLLKETWWICLPHKHGGRSGGFIEDP